MKNRNLLIGTLFLTLFYSCGINDTAIDQINDCKKPAVVISKHQAIAWWDHNEMTIKDSGDELIELDRKGLSQLIDKYSVGDTINTIK